MRDLVGRGSLMRYYNFTNQRIRYNYYNNSLCWPQQNCWPRMKLVFTGSVFRSHSKQDEGFLGGGRWKYNIKTSELYAFSKTGDSQEEGAEGNETVGDDATVASKDCAAGLIRMGLLPRIRYILEVYISRSFGL